MIKFLHTADLHLGKVFYEQSLAEDQAAMLNDLVCLLRNDSYAALIIAGDVYDRSIPSPQAIELFGDFLGSVKRECPSLEILVIPGNHDSAARLGFGKELFARLGIRFQTFAGDCDTPVIVEKDGEKCAFFLLPFLYPGVFEGDDSPLAEGARSETSTRSQAALAREAAHRTRKAREELAARGVSYSVLAAHLFASGGAEAGSERVFVGTAEQVNISLFEGFDYIALGHLHRCQRVGENAWYAGSPLAYSFSETELQDDSGIRTQQEKFFLSVELTRDGAKVDKIPVTPSRRVTSVTGTFARFAGTVPADTNPAAPGDNALLAVKDDYLEIRLTDRGITENARDILRRRFPRLLSLRQDEALAGLSGAREEGRAYGERLSGERRNVSADFRDFLASLYGETDRADLPAEIELFNALLAEVEAEKYSS